MISKKIKNLNPSPTLALADKARRLKREGKDVIALSVGEPDWNTSDDIIDALCASVKSGFTKYVPASGILDLQEVVAKDTNSYLNTDYTAKNVSVTSGAKFSIFSCLQSVLDPQDEVIIPSPYWVSYPDMVTLAGGVPVVVPCKSENRFKLTASDLKTSITKKTKLVMLNSPNNPTGEVYTLDELKSLADVLSKHDKVMILSDDIYNKLVFEYKHAPNILNADPSLIDRTVIINGMSKAFSMTGWRIGWGVAPETVAKAMSKFQSQSVSCAVSFCQKASVTGLKNQNLTDVIKTLKKRKDTACNLISKINGLKIKSPGGAFYLWIDISHFLNKKIRGVKLATSVDLSKALLESEHVAVVPGTAFGVDGFIRMSYALDEKTINNAIGRMENFFSSCH